MSTAVTRTVTAVGETIASPTLPSGISVATAPFAVSVTWPGTYATSSFTGFKSIDIYAVSSDLGSTTTSGITGSNLVGSLTVQDTPNKINIGLDNLRQALGLSTNADVYTTSIFYYFNSSNKNGEKFGSPTYTRINSSSIIPTKANFIDIESGVISIENLVAGNGSFSSWLRTGTAGGARIELSAISDFTNGGNTVQKGLVAYSSGNTELFNLDLDASTLTINGSGTFTGNLSIGSSNAIFKADPSTGIWLGDATYASAPFRVSTNGVIKANSGTIGGWTLGSTFLQGTNFEINSSSSTIFVGPTGGQHIRMSASGGIATYNGGTQTGGFDLTTSGSLTLSGTLTAASGSSIGGWTTGSTTITGGSTTLDSNGTITISGTYPLTITNTLRFSSPSLTWGSTSSPTFEIYQFAGGGGSVIAASEYLFISAATRIEANQFLIQPSGSISTPGSATFGFPSGFQFEFLSSSGNLRVAQTYNNDMGGTTRAMRVSSAGMYGYVSSTRRRKEQINNYSINSQALLSLPVRKFKYIDDETDIQQYGFIAEEAQDLGLDELIQYDSTGIPDYFAYETLPIFLLQIIQEQDASIKSLESRLDALEG
jgi:hypothetical protein